LIVAQQIAGIGSWEFDLETGLSVCSKEIFRILGLSDGQQLSAPGSVVAFAHEEDREQYAAWFA
jgi:hypothetical protein